MEIDCVILMKWGILNLITLKRMKNKMLFHNWFHRLIACEQMWIHGVSKNMGIILRVDTTHQNKGFSSKNTFSGKKESVKVLAHLETCSFQNVKAPFLLRVIRRRKTLIASKCNRERTKTRMKKFTRLIHKKASNLRIHLSITVGTSSDDIAFY